MLGPYKDMANNPIEILVTATKFCQVSFASGAGFQAADIEHYEFSHFKGHTGIASIVVWRANDALEVIVHGKDAPHHRLFRLQFDSPL